MSPQVKAQMQARLDKVAAEKTKSDEVQTVERVVSASHEVPKLQCVGSSPAVATKPKFNKTDYMRVYMQKRRAEAAKR